jgi:hypothetical protein
MFDQFLLDAGALDLLRRPGHRVWLREWSELISALEAEGALTAVDVAAAAGASPHQRGAMLRRDLEQPSRWSGAMAYHNSLIAQAEQFLGDSPAAAQSFSWRFDPETGLSAGGDDGETHDLSVVLEDGEDSSLGSHRHLHARAVDVLKQQLREVNSCVTACNELGAAPVMWAPYRRYLEEKLRPPARAADEAQEAGRQFFKIAFPAYLPSSVRGFAKLRSDKRIAALRDEIRRSASSGEVMDPQYPQRVFSEVLRLEHRAARLRRIVGWIATGVGLIPVPGLGVAASIASEAITMRLERKQQKPWHWFYLISDGRGGS